MLLLVAIVSTSEASINNNHVNDFDFYYINGIDASAAKAASDSRLAGERLGVPDRVKSLYNPSYGLVYDLLEAYVASAADAGNIELFWRQINYEAPVPPEYAGTFWSIIASHIGVPVSIRPDAIIMLNEIQQARAPDEKVVILSHSEGNFLSNYIVGELANSDPSAGQDCTGIVAVGTPATYVENNDPWVNNSYDGVLTLARLFLPGGQNILANNAATFTLNALTGHSFGNTYLKPGSDTANKIIAGTTAVVNRLNADCNTARCGQALQPAGGQGRQQRFTYAVSNPAPHPLTVAFEAFHVPDRMQVYAASGQLLYDTGGLVSGYHQHTVNFNPAVHGASVDVVVDAPTAGTAWEVCVDCQQGGSGCGLLQDRNSVPYAFYRGDGNWSCSINALMVDGQPLPSTGFGNVLLTPGQHRFTLNGSCFCTSPYGNFCNNGPYMRINHFNYYDLRHGFTFSIN